MENSNEQVLPKRGPKKLILIGLVLFILFAGAGGGFYVWKIRTASASAAENHSTEEAPATDEDEVKAIVDLPPFIVNLTDDESPRYLRMSVSLGLAGEGGKSEKPDPVFSTKTRNAILAVISSKKSGDILTSEGKDALRKEILAAAQSVTKEPQVAAIYITEFIVQL